MRVSLSPAAEGGRIRVALAALCTVTALVIVAAAAPSPAHAAFTIGHCNGAAVAGQGSSAQKEAQQELWSTTLWRGADGCGSSAPTVTYAPEGSGCGIASIGGEASKAECFDLKVAETGPGIRAASTRFGGSDAPLTVTQQISADAAGGEHPGLIHQIPVAAFAVAIIVHFPDGCTLKNPAEPGGNGDTSTGGLAAGVKGTGSEVEGQNNDPVGGYTGDTYKEETLRVHITAAEMEKIWDGTPQTWKEIVPEADMEVDPNATKNTVTNVSECGSLPVTRIVRFDGSGTTFNFKSYLSLLPGAPSLWTESPVAGDKTNWPITAGGEKNTPKAVIKNATTHELECPSAEPGHICTAETNGGGSLTEAVTAVNGSIGYADLATSRKHGFYMEAKKDDHTYWVPMQTVSPEKGNEVGSTYAEPAEVSTSNLKASPEGANCTDADYRGYPTEGADPTLGDWEKAIATGATATSIASEPIHAYPVCGLTYDFAWDDDASVYGEGGEEQAKARTVKDYLETIESSQGQYQLALRDYGTLPANIIQIAQNGVKAIDWKKEATSNKKEETKPPATATTTTTTTTTTTATTPPSNAFSIASAKVKGKDIVLSLILPDAGNVSVKAKGGGVTVASASAGASGGKGTVTLVISKAALSKLAKAKGHKLSVKITVTFTPTGGTAATQTKTLTVTQAAVKAKKKASKKKGKKK